MLVVPDVDEPFVPLPDDLLVNLRDARESVDAALDTLPAAFASTTCVESCTGPVLQTAGSVTAVDGRTRGLSQVWKAAGSVTGVGMAALGKLPASTTHTGVGSHGPQEAARQSGATLVDVESLPHLLRLRARHTC
eukprot:354808-Chlamydomonas_euryale.AAC.2